MAFDFDCEGPSTRVIFAGSRMDLFHYPSRFLPFYAGQVVFLVSGASCRELYQEIGEYLRFCASFRLVLDVVLA